MRKPFYNSQNKTLWLLVVAKMLTTYSMADSDCCDLIKGNRQALGQSSVFFRKSINDKRSLRLGFAFLKGIIQH